ISGPRPVVDRMGTAKRTHERTTMTASSRPDPSAQAPAQTIAAAVIGGGPAGLVAALALAHFAVPTVLVAQAPAQITGVRPVIPVATRPTALMRPSVTALETLGVWPRCREHAAPLRVMRIVDDTGRLWRAPEVRFEAAEIGLDAFAWNIENRHLVAALWERVAALPSLIHLATSAISLSIGPSGAAVTLADGATLHCLLVIAADGRNSICRAAAGIAMDSRSCPQTALTFTLAHAR